jgi:hypothetical protein
VNKLALYLVLGSSVAMSDTTELSQPLLDVLTPVDSIPSQQDLLTVFTTDNEAVSKLVEIVSDPSSDVGVELRAIHALTQYRRAESGVGAIPHDTLVNIVLPRFGLATSGSDLLLLSATIQAIGSYPDKDATNDLAALLPFLDHASRDVRVATAHALRDLGNTNALIPLANRQKVEHVNQVELAINEALRVLGTPN